MKAVFQLILNGGPFVSKCIHLIDLKKTRVHLKLSILSKIY